MSLFDWAAPVFHRYADRWSEQHIAEMADRLAPYLGERRAVLDLGGGTGALAVRMAEAFPATVTVLDPSPKMVGYVPNHPRVSAVVGGAEAMPFTHDAYDVVVISDAFHHFRDQDAAVREISRVTRREAGCSCWSSTTGERCGSWYGARSCLANRDRSLRPTNCASTWVRAG